MDITKLQKIKEDSNSNSEDDKNDNDNRHKDSSKTLNHPTYHQSNDNIPKPQERTSSYRTKLFSSFWLALHMEKLEFL